MTITLDQIRAYNARYTEALHDVLRERFGRLLTQEEWDRDVSVETSEEIFFEVQRRANS